MCYFIILSLMLNLQEPQTIFEFKSNRNLEDWQVIDDTVMGGVSNGLLRLDGEGNGVFKGDVSIENNGGFSSIQLSMESIKVNSENSIKLIVKGDGSSFQFRIKNSKYDRHSYVVNFKTSGKWENILIPMNEMTPRFRGYKMSFPNFNKSKIESIGFLKSSKKNTSFKLQIKSVSIVR